jgi:hypothetical protein
MRKKRLHIEDDEQALLFRKLTLYYPNIRQLTFHIPNGGKRTKLEAIRLRAQGVTAGVPDIFCAFASGEYHGLFIEMKKPIVKGESKPAISPAQKLMIEHLLFQGYCVKVCYGCAEALDTIVQYWNLYTA